MPLTINLNKSNAAIGEEDQRPDLEKRVKIEEIKKIVKYANFGKDIYIIFPGTNGWISVYDVLGRKVYESKAKPGKNEIDLKRSGIYFIKVGGEKKEVYWVPKK